MVSVIDCKNLRNLRQIENDEKAYNSILSGSIDKKYINAKQFDRTLKFSGVSEDELISSCKENKLCAKLLASNVSINASRQGSKDESYIFNEINKIISDTGIFIESLGKNEYRPSKSGEMLKNVGKRNDCLKSMDGKISGKIKGWIAAKVVFTNGGHQDNVFEECSTYCQWFRDYGRKDELFVMMIDTDMTKRVDALKKEFKRNGNIMICNHVELQEYLLELKT